MCRGAELMKIFATAKILQAKQALLLAAGQVFFKFSIAISINCVGKMFIWGHFCSIMELLLNNYLGHFLIIEKTFVFLFIESAIKLIPWSHANVQIPWPTKCNWLNWWQPECFCEPESPVTTPKSCQMKLPIHNITGLTGGCASILGQISLQLMEELGCSKRLADNCTIMNN